MTTFVIKITTDSHSNVNNEVLKAKITHESVPTELRSISANKIFTIFNVHLMNTNTKKKLKYICRTKPINKRNVQYPFMTITKHI